MYGTQNRPWIGSSWNCGNSFRFCGVTRKAEKIVRRIRNDFVEVVATSAAIGFGAFAISRVVGIV